MPLWPASGQTVYLGKKSRVNLRSKWLEEGEQNSSYFFNLGQHHSTINAVVKLNISGVITEDDTKCFR